MKKMEGRYLLSAQIAEYIFSFPYRYFDLWSRVFLESLCWSENNRINNYENFVYLFTRKKNVLLNNRETIGIAMNIPLSEIFFYQRNISSPYSLEHTRVGADSFARSLAKRPVPKNCERKEKSFVRVWRVNVKVSISFATKRGHEIK